MAYIPCMSVTVRPGSPFPLGVHFSGSGVNVAVYSSVADQVLLCLFDADGDGNPVAAARPGRRGLARSSWTGSSPARSTGSGCTGRTIRPAGQRCNPAKLLLDPYAGRSPVTVSFGPAVYGHDLDNPRPGQRSRLRRRRAARADGRTACTAGSGLRGCRYRPASPDPPGTCPIRCSTRSTSRVSPRVHPDIPAEIRGTYAGLAHPAAIAPPEAAGDHRRGIAAGAPERAGGIPRRARADQLLGIQHDRVLRAACRVLRGSSSRAVPAGRSAEFQDMVRALHAAGIEVILDVVYNHTTEAGPDGPTLSLARAGQRGLLPARPERPGRLHRHLRLRQCAERRKSGLPAIDHGLAALLGDGDGRRRVPVRSRTDAGASGGRVRHHRGVLRSGLAGPGAGAGRS